MEEKSMPGSGRQEGEKKPRFRVVGIAGVDLKVYAEHIRKSELEALAADTGAEIVYLPEHGTGDKKGRK